MFKSTFSKFRKSTSVKSAVQTDIENKIKVQLTSLLEKDGTLIVPHPTSGDYFIRNAALNISFLIKTSENRIITTSNGVVDNSLYTPIIIDAIKNNCDNHLKGLFESLEESIQTKRVNSLNSINTLLNVEELEIA